MYDDIRTDAWDEVHTRRTRLGAHRLHSLAFASSKRLFDYGFSLILLPALLSIAGFLWLANRFTDPGPVFYSQRRMGKHGREFWVVKFRTMREVEDDDVRSHDQGVETDRITAIGGLLRRFRIDEIPNIINVLRGEMSIVGPRPDAIDHAVEFTNSIPMYRARHRVRPGITGLAQVEMGYAEGVDATREKALWDARYVEYYGFRQEALILLKTAKVVLTGFGAK